MSASYHILVDGRKWKENVEHIYPWLSIFTLTALTLGETIDLHNQLDSASKQPIIINCLNSHVPAHIHVTINNTTYAQSWFSEKSHALASAMHNTQQKLLNLKEYSVAYCKENKGFLACCAVVAGYSIVLGRLVYLHHVLSNEHQWSLWKQEFTLEQLLALPQKELAKELLFTIQQRYHTPATVQDFFVPLISFFNDTEYELTLLKQFDMLHHYIDTLHLSWIFPSQQIARKEIPTRIEKADYFKQLLITWLAEYKIASVPVIHA